MKLEGVFMPASQDESEFIKQRELCFNRLSTLTDPVSSAKELLSDIPGILSVKANGNTCIVLRYRLDQVNLMALEDGLNSLGYLLDQGLIQRFKRAYYHYVEETQLANMGLSLDSKSTTRIFIEHYEQRPHGCRDERPSYYHHYD
jgi:hypothetical protein